MWRGPSLVVFLVSLSSLSSAFTVQQPSSSVQPPSSTQLHVAAEIAADKKRTREVSSLRFCLPLPISISLFIWYTWYSHNNQYHTTMSILKTKQQRLEAASKGLQVHVVGLSIHHADVEVREKLAVPEAEWSQVSREIVGDGSVVAEAAVLSTCNRFEVFFSSVDARPAVLRLSQYLSERGDIPMSVLRSNLFLLSGEDCVDHVLRVSGGLDSLVVGEGQILSQVRQCYLHASSPEGSGGKVLSRLLNTAVSAGKRVRSETAISKGSVSISSAAVELSELLSDADLNLPFSEARLAVVGAGKMTRLLITHLASRGLEAITIVNRSVERPQELAEQFPDVDIEIKLMDDLWDVVGKSDIVYTATSSVDYVIDAEKLQANGLASGKPLMLVDISVPRNVNEDCKEVRVLFIVCVCVG